MENMTNDMMPKQNKTKMLSVVFVSIIIVILLAFVGLTFYKKLVAPSGPVITDKLPVNYHYQVIPQGQYPKNFPTKVIVNTKDMVGVWSRSEDTITSDGKRLKVLELTYKNTDPVTLAPLFENNFKTQGWTIVPSKSISGAVVVRSFDNTKGSIPEIATLTIIKLNTNSLVNITISTK